MAFEHLRQHQLDQRERRHHVRVEVLVEQIEGSVDETVHVARADVPAVVEQEIDRSPFVEDGCDCGLECGAVEQICGHGERTPAFGLDRVPRSQ